MAVVVAESIADQIFEGNIPPGTTLPTELRMAAQFGVGRATVREALRLLEAQGLVHVRPGPQGGPVVQQPSAEHLNQLLSMIFAVSGVSFAEVLVARLLVEPVMALNAALQATPDEVERLVESIERQRHALGNEREFLQLNDEFHALIAAASRSRVLATLLSSMRAMSVGQQLGVRYDAKSREGTLLAHRRIVELIAARDPERANAAMAKHLQALEEYLMQRYPEVLDGQVQLIRQGVRAPKLVP
jgi:DNA-binding FadR family transcriptional regulator